MRNIDLGNNESIKTGWIKFNGFFIAITPSASKEFKTKKGAINWLSKKGFNSDGSRI